MTPRQTLEITSECSNDCRICGRSGLDAPTSSFAERLASARALGRHLTLTGGEPTLEAGLVDAVRDARGAGFTRLGVQSNGARFDDELAGELADAGLTDVHFTVHAARAEGHDFLTRTEGSHELVNQAIGAARRRDLVVAVTTVVTRSTFRDLAELAPWLARRSVAAWCIAIPRAAGALVGRFEAIAPRLALAVPYALHAMAQAKSRELPTFISGAPACLLGPFASQLLAGEDLAFGEACGSCEGRDGCHGLDPTYLARFEADELRPRAAWERATHPLRELFIGHGPLRLPTAGAGHAAGAGARLPLAKRQLDVVD